MSNVYHQTIEQIINIVRHNIDKPFVLRKMFNPAVFTWNDVDSYFNSPAHHSTIELIGLNQRKIPLNRHWSLCDGKVYDLDQLFYSIINGFSFILINMSRRAEFFNQLCNQLENLVNGPSDVHIYGGLTTYSKSFKIHQDEPNNLILQLDGESDWQVWDSQDLSNLGQPVIDTKLLPGDIIYIPKMMCHLCTPVGKRISASIPFESGVRVNRKWYSLDNETVQDYNSML